MRVQVRGEAGDRTLGVFCPRTQRLVDTVLCGRCAHGCGLSYSSNERVLHLRCAWRADAGPLLSDEGERSLASLVHHPVHCVAQDAELDAVLDAFLSATVDALPVVGENGRAVGILSKSDLLRWYCARPRQQRDGADAAAPIAIERTTSPRVREAMSHLVYTLDARADIARAAALMAYEHVHQIVITHEDGRPFGLVSSLDILGWIARASGYLIAPPESAGCETSPTKPLT